MALFKFDPNATVVVVDVELENNGRKTTKRMALDTGATYILFPWEVAGILGMKPEVSEERIETVTASGVEKVPLVSFDSVRVLGKEAKNVKAIVQRTLQKWLFRNIQSLRSQNFELLAVNFFRKRNYSKFSS